MSNYRRGVVAERRTMRVLEAQGYTVTRSAGSHGPWDVTAVSSTEVRLVQVKRGAGRVSAVELEVFQAVPVPANVSREVWTWPPHARQPRVERI